MSNNQLNFAVGITPHSMNMIDRIEEVSSLKKSIAKMLSDENYLFAIADKDVVYDRINDRKSIFFIISIVPHSSQKSDLVREDLRIRKMICEACGIGQYRCMVSGIDNEAYDMSKLHRIVRL